MRDIVTALNETYKDIENWNNRVQRGSQFMCNRREELRANFLVVRFKLLDLSDVSAHDKELGAFIDDLRLHRNELLRVLCLEDSLIGALISMLLTL